MKVILLSRFDPFGSVYGGEVNTHNLAASLAQRGNEVWVVHGGQSDGFRRAESGVIDVPVRALSIPIVGGVQANMTAATRLERLTSEHEIDILDMRGAGLALAASRASTRVRARVFHAVDSVRDEFLALSLGRRLRYVPVYLGLVWTEGMAIRDTDGVITDTKPVCESLRQHYPNSRSLWDVIPPGVPNRWVESVTGECDPTQFLYIGAGPRRDLQLFADALALAAKRGVRLRGVVLREDASKVRQISRKSGAVLTYLPPMSDSDLHALFGSSCAFVLPSLREAFCTPILEAATHGTPSVVSDLSTVKEFVQNGHSGYVVADRRADSWADALIKMSTDPALRSYLGRNAKDLSRKFTMDQIAKRTEDFYHRVLGRSYS